MVTNKKNNKPNLIVIDNSVMVTRRKVGGGVVKDKGDQRYDDGD